MDLRTKCSTPCFNHFCLPNIFNPMYIEQLSDVIPPPSQNTVKV